MNPPKSLHESLHLRLSARPSKTLITTIAAESMADEKVLDALLSFLHNGKDSLRWRAAWALEKVAGQCPSLLIGERPQMRALALHPDTPHGLRRLLLSILHHLPDDEELDAFLFSLGCYQGQPITVVAHRRSGMTVSIKDARYSIDNRLAEAIII